MSCGEGLNKTNDRGNGQLENECHRGIKEERVGTAASRKRKFENEVTSIDR